MKQQRGIPKKGAKEGFIEVTEGESVLKRFYYKLKNKLSRDAAKKAAAAWIKEHTKNEQRNT